MDTLLGLLILVLLAIGLAVLAHRSARRLGGSGSTRGVVGVGTRPRVPGRIYYRTLDGQADYGFAFERRPGGWRIYILEQPSYRNRATDDHSTHRLSDEGRRFICWAGHLSTEREARQVARQWADLTQRYIRTGQRFG